MQGKGFSLRLGLLACVAVLIFGMLGGLSLARDAFDDDYDDCPASTRIDAVNGLAIDRTDEEDEIRISWDALDTSVLNGLGANAYKARLTIIVDDDGDIEEQNVALGDTSRLFDGIKFANDVTVSVAITQSNYVISDIAEAEFTSGMPAPSFKTDVWLAADTDVDEETTVADSALQDAKGVIDLGSFYYLGFNNLFDNWFVSDSFTFPVDQEDRPTTPKFRVGLKHGAAVEDPGDADFENYRITIEDSSGDLLGYQAETVEATRTYGATKIVFGGGEALVAAEGAAADPTAAAIAALRFFSNVRLSNQHADGPVSPYYLRLGDNVNPHADEADLSYANLVAVTRDANDVITGFVTVDDVYADPPAEYFDFPSDVFEDDGNYIIKAWAEDGDGTRISPQASIKLSAQEGERIAGPDADAIAGFSNYGGYNADGIRTWDAAVADNSLIVYGLTIQDE